MSGSDCNSFRFFCQPTQRQWVFSLKISSQVHFLWLLVGLSSHRLFLEELMSRNSVDCVQAKQANHGKQLEEMNAKMQALSMENQRLKNHCKLLKHEALVNSMQNTELQKQNVLPSDCTPVPCIAVLNIKLSVVIHFGDLWTQAQLSIYLFAQAHLLIHLFVDSQVWFPLISCYFQSFVKFLSPG